MPPELDPFAEALERPEQLRELYDAPMQAAVRKDIGHIDELCRRLIAAAPMLFVGTHSGEGRGDVSPRGGPPGFVTVLDDHHLAIPDATGNRRLDTLENVVSSGRAALIFVIPGRDTTLRVSGRAAVTAAPDVLDRLTPVGKPPKTAIVVEAEEVYTHCPKAFVRSKLWDPGTWPDPSTLPTSAEVTLAHQRNPELTLEQVEEREREALAKRLRLSRQRAPDQPIHHARGEHLRHRTAHLRVAADQVAGAWPARRERGADHLGHLARLHPALLLDLLGLGPELLDHPPVEPLGLGRHAVGHLVGEPLALLPDRRLHAAGLDQDHVDALGAKLAPQRVAHALEPELRGVVGTHQRKRRRGRRSSSRSRSGRVRAGAPEGRPASPPPDRSG